LLVNVEEKLGLQPVLTDESENYQDYKHAEEFGGQAKLSLLESRFVKWALAAVLVLLAVSVAALGVQRDEKSTTISTTSVVAPSTTSVVAPSTTSVVAPDDGLFHLYSALNKDPFVSIECTGDWEKRWGIGIAVVAELSDPWASYILTAPDVPCMPGEKPLNFRYGPNLERYCGAEEMDWIEAGRGFATCEVEPLDLWKQMESTQEPQPGDPVLIIDGSDLGGSPGVITRSDSNEIWFSAKNRTRGALLNSTGQLIGISTSVPGQAMPITAIDAFVERLSWASKP